MKDESFNSYFSIKLLLMSQKRPQKKKKKLRQDCFDKKLLFSQITPECGLDTHKIMFGGTLDFQCQRK